MDISCSQKKILDAACYNGKIKVLCYQNPGIQLDTDNQANTMDSIVYCKNECLFEMTIRHSPCILWISCESNSGKDPHQTTGVDALLPLPKNIQKRGIDYHLGALVSAIGNHFYSLALDSIPHGDINVSIMEIL